MNIFYSKSRKKELDSMKEGISVMESWINSKKEEIEAYPIHIFMVMIMSLAKNLEALKKSVDKEMHGNYTGD